MWSGKEKTMNLMSKNQDRTIENIIRLMQSDRAADAPEDAVRWSKNLFRARVSSAAATPKTSVARKILAVLQMDLAGGRAAFGERSASSGQARQMLFQAGEAAMIDLRVKETENGFSVQGQILGADFAGALVRLGELQTKANERGEFAFEQVVRGAHRLSLSTNETEIVVEDLQVI
jgi:hypothetical protein